MEDEVIRSNEQKILTLSYSTSLYYNLYFILKDHLLLHIQDLIFTISAICIIKN